MSAYVVTDKTINIVVGRLATDRSWSWMHREIKDALGCDLDTWQGRKDLAEAMFKLNVRAVDARYGEGEASSFRPLDFEFGLVMTASRMQAYCALRCWLYQCTEGDVPEDSLLYSAMERIASHMADSIVRSLPEYERCKWE